MASEFRSLIRPTELNQREKSYLMLRHQRGHGFKSRWRHLKFFRCTYEALAYIVKYVRGSFLQFISKVHFTNILSFTGEGTHLSYTVACLIDQSANWKRQFCRSECCFWQNRHYSGKMIPFGHKKLSVWQIRRVSFVGRSIRPVSSHKWKANLVTREHFGEMIVQLYS